ncbi:MAG: hypothetical protein U1G07_15975 [Verrucomicrobiota bacterium]
MKERSDARALFPHENLDGDLTKSLQRKTASAARQRQITISLAIKEDATPVRVDDSERKSAGHAYFVLHVSIPFCQP